MRSFSFRAKNIGRERYLTYIVGEGCEIDEEVLDFCEENHIKELIDIIYEEDDDYDYLTYDVTGRMPLEKYISGVMNCEKVLNILRNIALAMVSCKEQAIHLSYILLNKGFMYIDPDNLEIKFICLPVESETAISTEFKGFVRQFLANLKYDVEEDLSYVGKLLTYINSDTFNLRGLIGLVEAIMEDSGLEHSDENVIESEDGAEVVNTVEEEQVESGEKKEGISDFINSLDSSDDVLPEIGDDDEEFEENFEQTGTVIPEGILKTEESDEAKTEDSLTQNNSETKTQTIQEETETAGTEKTEEKDEVSDKQEINKNISRVKLNEKAPASGETIEQIKARLERIVNGDMPIAKTVKEEAHSDHIRSLDELDELLESRPVIKKNTIKVNRAAIIQNAAVEQEESEEAEKQADEEKAVDMGQTEAKEETSEKGIETLSDAEEEKKKQAATPIRPARGANLFKGVSNANNSMFGTTGTLKISPYLVRVNTEERIMLTKPVFKLGKASRGVDYTIDGNGAVSRQHAIILQKDGSCYIKDNKSTNHTYVDGIRVEEGEEALLKHDCKVKLGDEEFVFKIR